MTGVKLEFLKQQIQNLAGRPAGSVLLGNIQTKFLPKKEYLTGGQLAHHVHIVGASGYGKTVLLSHIIKQKIESGQGALYIDLKGDLSTLESLKKYVSAAGRLDDLQIFSLSDQNLSQNYNLISEGTATQLRDRIMMSLEWSEEFYKNQAASYLLKLLIGLCFIRDQRRRPFGLKEILRAASDKAYLEDLVVSIPENCRSKAMLEECYQFLKEAGNYSSLQGLRTQLESLVLSDFGDRISGGGGRPEGGNWTEPSGDQRGEINLFSSVQNNKITFMFLDTRRYGETAKTVGRFILQDLKATSARIDAEIPEAQRKPFVCVIDEFADLAQEDFISFLDRARSSKMSIVVAHQELADLKRISPEFAARLTGNTSTLYAFLQKNGESAEMISGMAGTRTVWKSTMQTERMFFIEMDSGKGSKREVEEFNIHPNLIKSLPVGHCVVIKKYPQAEAYLVRVSEGD